jgi:hypothetical protein
MDKTEWEDKETKTYEVTASHADERGYVNRRVIYRLWEVEDGDWKIYIVDTAKDETPAILLPKKVIDTIIKVTVKGELKK